MTVKQQAINLIERLSEDCSWEEVEYRLYVARILHERIEEADSPDAVFIPHEQVAREMREKWNAKLSG